MRNASGFRNSIGTIMNHISLQRIILSSVIISALIVQPSAYSASDTKNGSTCKKVGANATTSSKQKLVCTMKGKKLFWKIVVTPKPVVTSSASPSPTPTPTMSASPSASPTPTLAVATASLMSTECIALLVKIGLSKDAPETAGSGFNPNESSSDGGMDAQSKCTTNTGKTDVITASPFTLTDIASITKYRSCSGHDYAEGSADGQTLSKDPTYEKFSSMKHYISPVKQSSGDRTDIFSPYDGIISRVSGVATQGGGGGVQVDVIPYANPSVTLTFMHIFGVTVKAGDAVKSGEKIAYHEVLPANVGHSSFDIVIGNFDKAAMFAHARKLSSMMSYLAPSIMNSYSSAGITLDNAIWPAAFRASNPCAMTGNQGFFVGPESSADRVYLKH